jgi:hypothetical protein
MMDNGTVRMIGAHATSRKRRPQQLLLLPQCTMFTCLRNMSFMYVI